MPVLHRPAGLDMDQPDWPARRILYQFE